MDKTFRSFQNAGNNLFRICQFPQFINMDSPVVSGYLMGNLRLSDTAFNRTGNQILMPLLTFYTHGTLHYRLAVFIIKISADQRNCPDTTLFGKMPAAASVRSVNTFSSLNYRENFLA